MIIYMRKTAITSRMKYLVSLLQIGDSNKERDLVSQTFETALVYVRCTLMAWRYTNYNAPPLHFPSFVDR